MKSTTGLTPAAKFITVVSTGLTLALFGMMFWRLDALSLRIWAVVAGVSVVIWLVYIAGMAWIRLVDRMFEAAWNMSERRAAQGWSYLTRLNRRSMAAAGVGLFGFVCLWIASAEPYETISKGQWRLLGATACLIAGAAWWTRD